MWTRNALDLTARFPHLARALSRVVVGDAVIDGEIVALDSEGRPALSATAGGRSGGAARSRSICLWLNGEDLRARPLDARRDLLHERHVEPRPVAARGRARRGADRRGAGRACRVKGCEGLIAKRRGSTYVGTRSKDWLKLKSQKSQEVAIIGFTPSTANEKMIGALLLGVVKEGALAFAGKVGTGFSTKQRAELKKELSKDAVGGVAGQRACRACATRPG